MALASSWMGLLVISFVASKLGAGFWHIVPMIVINLYFFLAQKFQDGGSETKIRANRSGSYVMFLSGVVAVTALLSMNSILNSSRFIIERIDSAAEITAELEAVIQRAEPDELIMGYALRGDNYEPLDSGVFAANFQFLLQMSGHRNALLLSTMNDFMLAKTNYASGLIDQMESCIPKTWLIPSGSDRPFNVGYWYSKKRKDLFDTNFQKVFQENYHKVAGTKNFDVYECRRP